MKAGRRGDIQALRGRIDSLNRRIRELLVKRGELVRRIGRLKEREGWKRYDPGRELEQLAEMARAPGPYTGRSIRRIFKEILQASRDILDRTLRER